MSSHHPGGHFAAFYGLKFEDFVAKQETAEKRRDGDGTVPIYLPYIYYIFCHKNQPNVDPMGDGCDGFGFDSSSELARNGKEQRPREKIPGNDEGFGTTWRIIPFSKWLVTIVSKSPK